jgi:hypothetical protein
MYGVNFQKRVLDRTVCVVGNSDARLELLQLVFVPYYK